MTFALRLNQCAITRGDRLLLSGLTLDLGPGQCVWLKGENGIGKSSVLRLACGLLVPAAGDVAWEKNGKAVGPEALCALQSHIDALRPTLTLEENLKFAARLSRTALDAHDALERAGLIKLSKRRVSTLSAGQRRRGALAKLLLDDKPIWLMDEPSAALDDSGQALVSAMVSAHLAAGGAAFVASHTPPQRLAQGTRVLEIRPA